MNAPGRLSFVSQGHRLNVWAWGEDEAPPLVLLHGVRDHARSWDLTAAAFAGRYRVIAPDLRGHGDSEWSGFYPTEAYLLDLAQMVEKLQLAPFDLIGHSLGGNIGLRYAALFPAQVRRIVAIEGLSHAPSMVEKQRPIEARLRDWIGRARETKPPRRYASLGDATARLIAEHPRLDAEFAAHLTAQGSRENGDGTVSFKFDPALRVFLPVEMIAEDAARLWSLIEAPTLLVYGGQSWASNPVKDGRAQHFRNAEVVTLDDAGHWAHHDRREAFVALAERFLTRLNSPTCPAPPSRACATRVVKSCP
jgi:pimeloyl-ACP methyl ester carboxylesterase